MTFIKNNYLFSPLEQFDIVTWVFTDFLLENVNLYSYFVLETEYDFIDRSRNEILGTVLFPTVVSSGWKMFIFAVAIALVWYGAKYIAYLYNDFSPVFFIALFHMVTGGFVCFWFSDFILAVEGTQWDVLEAAEFFNGGRDADNLLVSFFPSIEEYQFLPQVNFSILIDENLISFLAAFFLLGGSEEEEDEDFILEEEESDFVEDVVAPLFMSNLGKDVEDNGALFLKVCGIFGFVLTNNLMGMLPYSDTGTSSLILTFWVALSVFASLLTLMLRKHGINYLFNLFLPAGTPLPLIFLLIPIEFISYTFRLLSLSVRLFANMMAGHTLLKVIVGFSWSMILMGDVFLIANLFPLGILFILTFLELGVAIIQAYVFTILTCMYLKDIFVGH